MKESINKYSLPINRKPIIAKSDLETHVGVDKFAIDFIIPENTPVIAAAPGKIIYVKVDSNQGGDNIKFEDFKFYNYIIVKHACGEYTEYGHLKHLGTLKRLSDSVEEGEIIGFSGNTGYSAEPHLHFSVFLLAKVKQDFEELPPVDPYFISNPKLGFQTIKPQLKEKLNISRG